MGSWTEQTAFTSPGPHQVLVDAIGGDPATVVATVQGLLIHGGAVEHYGLPARGFSRQTLPIERRLDQILAIDPRPLTTVRAPQQRSLGTCRDYATLVCSIFRQNGKAARVRCGFASYFGGRPWEDHWICEVWMEERWRRVDAQLDPVLQSALRIALTADHLPADAFMTADEAWRVCRNGSCVPEAFGHGAEAGGLWFVLVNLVRDHLALADQMTSAWDDWRSAGAAATAIDPAIIAAANAVVDGQGLGLPLSTPWWRAA